MLPLLLDEGLPRSAADRLRQLGWDAVHVVDLDLSGAADDVLLSLSAKDARVVVSLDSDFPRLLALSSGTAPSVLLLRLQGLDTAKTVDLILRCVELTESHLRSGAVVVHARGELRVRSLPLR